MLLSRPLISLYRGFTFYMCKTYCFKVMHVPYCFKAKYNIDYSGHITLFNLSINFLFTDHIRVLVFLLKCS